MQRRSKKFDQVLQYLNVTILINIIGNLDEMRDTVIQLQSEFEKKDLGKTKFDLPRH